MKILASDFDGTLFFHNSEYRKEDLEAIEKFRKDGNLFGICTGRALHSLQLSLDERFQPDFMILNSGAQIVNGKGENVYKKTIPYELTHKFVRNYFQYKIIVAAENHIYSNLPFALQSPFAKTIDQIQQNEGYYCISVMLESEEAACVEAQNLGKIEEICVFQNKHSIDIIPYGCSKGNGIQILGDILNEQNQLYCIGDSYNDISMLESVPHSFTFYDSPIEVKKSAAHLVNSVAECINEITRME